MNTLFKIVFAGLFTTVINCSEKYREVAIPKLHYICQQIVEKDFYHKADQLFFLVAKPELDEADDQELQKLLEYNARLQNDPCVQVNIQLPSLLYLAQSNNGDTLLHLSAFNNSEKTTAQLLTAGADVNVQNNNGNTPLHWSAFKNAEKTTPLLVAAGSNVNAKNNNGNTPLHFSVIKNAEKTTTQLLNAGGDVQAKNNKGVTALRFAKSPKIQNLLVVPQEKQLAESSCLIS